MSRRKVSSFFAMLCALACAAGPSRAVDLSAPSGDLPPSAWIITLGGYGVLEPTYEGSKRYILGFKPLGEIRQADDKEWLSFPNDSFDYNLFETSNFRTGPSVNVTLQS